MGMQKAGVLLGVRGDDMTDSSDALHARARRILTPQREYPIFTPGIRESVLLPPSSDLESRASFQDSADGQGIWKEIHTDTESTQGHSSRSLSLETGRILLTSSASATSPDQHAGPLVKPSARHRSPRGAEYMKNPAVIMSSSPGGGMLPASRVVTSDYYVSLPNTPEQRPYSPNAAAMTHSPQNINLLSPQLRPLEKSPKLTQLHISSPRLTAQGGIIIPVVNHLTLSPDQGIRPAHDTVRMTSDPLTMTNPVHGSTVRLKKLMKSRQAEQSPRPSVSKDRSPRRSWKKSFGAVSPLVNVRGLSKDMSNSFQTRKGRGPTVNSSWRGDGASTQAVVARASDLDRDISQDSSAGEFEPPDPPQRVMGGKKLTSTLKSGNYNIFNFLSWGKRKSASAQQKLNESFQSDMGAGSVKGDTDSIKVLDYTIKTLRYKLEEANNKCLAAEEEVRALQSAAMASDDKCRALTQRCQELELQLSARRSGLHWDLELETPNQFLKVFEDSQACIRKLASAICHHVRESGGSATQVITSLLEQHKVGRSVTRMPRNVIILYFESFLNQVMFESFENVSFEPNGASEVLDPDTLRQTCYQAYQNLRHQEWGTIEKSLGKPGALVVNASFHRFFVVRMELVLSQLGKLAESEISLSLMASFFNAVKAVWLVHHLAFAFDQPVSIFRVSPSVEFDPRFMEQIPAFEQEPVKSKVSIMVNPGFIVNRQTIKCQVFCSSTYQ